MANLLWSPHNVGNVQLSNRVVVAPMASGTADDLGIPGKKGMDIYAGFARSGAGMVILEHHAVSPEGFLRQGQYGLHRDDLVERHVPLARIFQDASMPAMVQLNHGGSASRNSTLEEEGLPPLGPSAISHPNRGTPVPREMSLEECERIRECFVRAGLRALQAGYSGVEVHSCHGFLLGQFLSPLTNQRRDKYGGTIEGRSRLLRDIVASLREVLKDAPLSVRLGVADELGPQPRGLAFEDVLWVALELKALGVDMISLSGNFCGFDAPYAAPWAPYSEAVQEKVGTLPVLCTGNIRTPEKAEELLQRRACTFIGIGRPLLQDSTFFQKWRKDLS